MQLARNGSGLVKLETFELQPTNSISYLTIPSLPVVKVKMVIAVVRKSEFNKGISCPFYRRFVAIIKDWVLTYMMIWDNFLSWIRRSSHNVGINGPTGLSATQEDHPITGVRECGLPLSYATTVPMKVTKASLSSIFVVKWPRASMN